MNIIKKLFGNRSARKFARKFAERSAEKPTDNNSREEHQKPTKNSKSSLMSRKIEFSFMSDANRKQLSALLVQLQTAYAPLKERLEPLIKYYKGLNKREKFISRVGGTFILGYIIFSLIVQPYQGWRSEVIIARDAAYEEFTWLRSQSDRVKEAILVRGGDFNAILDINQLSARHTPTAKVEQLVSGEYIITVSEAQGTNFFNLINSVINRGGTLISVEFSRESRASRANFVAKVSI
ncbi:MAG: type II secretion system protein M [Candidatus Portiera sp.]|nr:type II secretion system protein M [Portiera sp.]